MNKFIPVSAPDLTDLEKKYMNEAFDSGWISSTGKFVDRFETEWAVASGSEFSLSVSNGTVAIHLILAALKIGPGDEVIVPSLTFIATANAVMYVGATPVFADVEEKTWCLDPESVKNLVTDKTKAVIAVHLYGNPADMESLAEICDESGIYLIEDAAEAPYGEINGKKLGSFGIAASFSFYGNKIVSSGEGGAVTTSDLDLYKSMKLLRGQGMDPKRRYYFSEIGFNFRLTNIACAILCAQMERASEMIQTRNRIYEKYDSILRNHPYFSFQQSLPGHKTSPWLYTLLIKGVDSEKRDRIIFELASREVETRPIFIPIHTLPPYTRMRRDHLHKTDMLGQSGLSLPTFSSMKISDAERVAIHLLEVLENS